MKLLTKIFGKNIFTLLSNYANKADYRDYYSIKATCSNCKYYSLIYVKKGVHVNDVIHLATCTNCGVRLEKI